jgi:hypothetical protein
MLYAMKIYILVLFLVSGLFVPRITAQQPNSFHFQDAQDIRYTAYMYLKGGNIPGIGSFQSNGIPSLLLAKSQNQVLTNSGEAGTVTYGNRWKAQGRGGSQTGKGALIGMAAGTILGGLIGFIAYKEPTPKPKGQIVFFTTDLGRGGSTAIGAISGLLSGAIVGAFIGHSRESDY